jgi:hypothetical protein
MLIHIEARNFQNIDLHTDQLLDALQHATLFGITKRNRNARRTSSTRSANTMHVGFFFGWHVVKINVRHKIHIDPASSDVCRHKNRRTLTLELFQNSLSLVLALVRVNRFRLKSGRDQVAYDSVSPVLGSAEDDRS